MSLTCRRSIAPFPPKSHAAKISCTAAARASGSGGAASSEADVWAEAAMAASVARVPTIAATIVAAAVSRSPITSSNSSGESDEVAMLK